MVLTERGGIKRKTRRTLTDKHWCLFLCSCKKKKRKKKGKRKGRLNECVLVTSASILRSRDGKPVQRAG